jgi:hypothetical protein
MPAARAEVLNFREMAPEPGAAAARDGSRHDRTTAIDKENLDTMDLPGGIADGVGCPAAQLK